jgi:hypothetical protein
MIATPVGDLPLLNDRYEFGVLARSIDATEYRNAIRSALRDRPRRFSDGLHALAKEFALEAITERFIDDIGLS